MQHLLVHLYPKFRWWYFYFTLLLNTPFWVFWMKEDQIHNLCPSSITVHPGSESPALPSLVSSKSRKLVLFISVSLVDKATWHRAGIHECIWGKLMYKRSDSSSFSYGNDNVSSVVYSWQSTVASIIPFECSPVCSHLPTSDLFLFSKGQRNRPFGAVLVYFLADLTVC